MSETVYDGNISFLEGQNDGLYPDRISKGQVARLINCTTKRGVIKCRPGIHQISENLSELTREEVEIYMKGKFQGAAPYTVSGNPGDVTCLSGRLFFADYVTHKVHHLKISNNDYLDPYVDRHNWTTEAGRFLIWYDDPAQPAIIDGLKVRRSDLSRKESDGVPLPEIPAGNIGVFVQSRLMVGNGADEWGASDATGDRTNPDAPITFQESLVAGSPFVGQFFSVGQGKQITAMASLSSKYPRSKVQTTKYGPLLIATRKDLSVWDVNIPRAEWAQTTLSRAELLNTGMPGARCFVNVGADLIFISSDGDIFSLAESGQDEASFAGLTGISKEVENDRKVTDASLHKYSFLQLYKNRIFASAKPQRIIIKNHEGKYVYDYLNRGMNIMELDISYQLGEAPRPVWSGLWTGIQPVEAHEIGGDLVFWSKDTDGFNRKYVLREDSNYDIFNQTRYKITSRIYTRAYDYERRLQAKTEHSAQISFTNIKSDFQIRLDRRKNLNSNWYRWGTRKATQRCEHVNKRNDTGVQPFAFGEPEEKSCQDLRNVHNGFYKQQLRITIEGAGWELEDIKVKATLENESNAPDGVMCDETIPAEDRNCLEVGDWELYNICQTFQHLQCRK